jgi:hypothetical protein
VNLIFEVRNLFILLFENLPQVAMLSNQASHAHAQIFYDQGQVVEHTLEMGLFLLHLIGLVLQLFNCGTTGSDVPLQLLDFVVEHEFEFFKFLSLFLEFADALLFIPDCGFTLTQFKCLTSNVSFEFVIGRDKFVKLGLLVLDVTSQLLLRILLSLEFPLDFS